MYRNLRYVVLIGCLGLFTTSISAAISTSGAISKYHQGDFETAMYQFQQIADQRDSLQAANANFMLGKMYERGDGVLIDDQIAYSYYEKAANNGHSEARQRIQEFGSDESIVQDWYMEAAWDGDVDAQYNLGYLFETGMGVQIDKARALQWYEEAAKEQHESAQFRLGLMLISGGIKSRDLDVGKSWIKSAAENGNDVAMQIVHQLFGKVDDRQLVQAIRGVRTFEQSAIASMLAVIEFAGDFAKSGVSDNIANDGNQSSNNNSNEKQTLIASGSDVSSVDSTSPEISSQINMQLDPDLLVTMQLKKDASESDLSTFVEEQKQTQLLSFSNFELLLMSFTVILIGGFCWHKYRTPSDKTLAGISAANPDVGESEEENISDLLERLMVDSQAVINSNDIMPVFELDSDLAGAKLGKEKQVNLKQSAKRVKNSDNNSRLMAHDVNQSEIKLTAFAPALSFESFLPVNMYDVVLNRQTVEAMPTKQTKPESLAQTHHRIERKVSSQRVLETNSPARKVVAQKTPEQTPASMVAKDRMNGVAVGDKVNHKIVANEQSMADFSSLLSREAENKAQNEMAIVESYYNMGLMFANGDGITRNTKLGIRWLQKAADKGHRLAKVELEIIQGREESPFEMKLLSNFS